MGYFSVGGVMLEAVKARSEAGVAVSTAMQARGEEQNAMLDTMLLLEAPPHTPPCALRAPPDLGSPLRLQEGKLLHDEVVMACFDQSFQNHDSKLFVLNSHPASLNEAM